MLQLNLNEVPFSCPGSYLVFSLLTENNHWQAAPGLYLRSVHGTSGSYCPNSDSLIARIELLCNGTAVDYTAEASPSVLNLKHGEVCLSVTFADAGTILFQGIGSAVGMRISWFTKDYDFIQPVIAKTGSWYLMNHYTSSMRFMLSSQSGQHGISQIWDKVSVDYSQLTVTEENGSFLLVLEEVFDSWKDSLRDYDFAQAHRTQKQSFLNYLNAIPSVPDCFQPAKELIAYINWSSTIQKHGRLKRNAMLMSKNWMCSVWSWDHCFNALALSWSHPEEAWNQFMFMFDFQDASGRLPDCVNDVAILNNFTKPPIHGWILSKLRQKLTLSEAQLKEAFHCLEKWTNWWLTYHDQDEDGLCEYTHGNDSGWDNSTVFRLLPPVTSPDLAAFLILQMEELGELALLLNMPKKVTLWKARAASMMNRMLESLFHDGKPTAFQTVTKQEIQSDSLLLYTPIVLAKRLPQHIRSHMISQLKSSRFCTEYGFATESPFSNDYTADGYWRGPIWAPSTLIITDGLWNCGEKTFVQEIAHKFCSMVMKSGSAENFNALTGEGLRDRAYTWTGSVTLVMIMEYLKHN